VRIDELLYVFEDFTLDIERRELRCEGALTAVEPQVFDLLAHLIRNRERVISKDDLLAAIWKGRIVSEATLDSRINAARRAIRDSGEQQRLIKTVPRKGVRFVGTVLVQQSEEPATDAGPASTASRVHDRAADVSRQGPLPNRPSIAVLPFTNISGDPEQDYFADGMADEIITALSRCSGLFVIARNSSFTYEGKVVDVRQIGSELGVRYVLEGSVRRAGSRLRISGQLVNAESGELIWADRFDGEMGAVFELQDHVAESVAAAIEPNLERAEIKRLNRSPGPHVNVYDLLLRAQQLEYELTAESLTAALRYLERAIAIDGAYGPALALAAYCYAELSFFEGWSCGSNESAEALRRAWRAVELGRDDAKVLWMAAVAVLLLAQDYPRAKELLYRSLQINPNSAVTLRLTGIVEATTGDSSKGFDLLGRARRLSPRDPRDWLMSFLMTVACTSSGKYDEAITWAEKALTQKRGFAPALRQLAFALVKIGQRERAAEIVQEMLKIEPGVSISQLRTRVPFAGHRPVWEEFSEALRSAGLPE
jgi:TolB-like protein/tetratricopeptide (TPR) repeat protein